MDEVKKVLREEQIKFFQNNGITTVTVPTSSEGIDVCQKILEKILDRRTVLYVSGGKTPKILYKQLAEAEIKVGAVGMIDERYGKKWHAASNELMLQDTDLLRILTIQGISFYPILTTDISREETSDNYDQKARELLAQYSKSVGILGIGKDGHTSSIIPHRHDFHNPLFDSEQKNLFVAQFNDTKTDYHERIGMTFLGLSMLDIIIILAFGEDKKQALEMMFKDGSETEIPARFYTRPEIARKTILVTDQELS